MSDRLIDFDDFLTPEQKAEQEAARPKPEPAPVFPPAGIVSVGSVCQLFYGFNELKHGATHAILPKCNGKEVRVKNNQAHAVLVKTDYGTMFQIEANVTITFTSGYGGSSYQWMIGLTEKPASGAHYEWLKKAMEDANKKLSGYNPDKMTLDGEPIEGYPKQFEPLKSVPTPTPKLVPMAEKYETPKYAVLPPVDFEFMKLVPKDTKVKATPFEPGKGKTHGYNLTVKEPTECKLESVSHGGESAMIRIRRSAIVGYVPMFPHLLNDTDETVLVYPTEHLHLIEPSKPESVKIEPKPGLVGLIDKNKYVDIGKIQGMLVAGVLSKQTASKLLGIDGTLDHFYS